MLDRFYAPTSLDSPVIELSEDESHHLARVLRKKIGDHVTVFDGQGRAATGEVETVGRRSARVRIIERCAAVPPARPKVVLTVPLPKGNRARWLIEKAAEVGVDAVIPLQTARSVVDPGASRLDKLRQTVIAACKQCGRNRLMEVCEPRNWPDVAAELGPAARILVADPSGAPAMEVLSKRSAPHQTRCVVAVGPEGGFTAEELSLARGHGAEAVSLGPHVLRVETASIVLAALVIAAAQSW